MKSVAIVFASAALWMFAPAYAATSQEDSTPSKVAISLATDGLFARYFFSAHHSVYAGASYTRFNDGSDAGDNSTDTIVGSAVGYRSYFGKVGNVAELKNLLDIGVMYDHGKSSSNIGGTYKTNYTRVAITYGLEYMLSKTLGVEANAGILYSHVKTEASYSNIYRFPITSVGLTYYFK